MRRLILDTSTIARWTGPALGIVRVEHELARHALAYRPDVMLSFYDADYDAGRGALRQLSPLWQAHVLSLTGTIDTIDVEYRRPRTAWQKLMPSRYPMMMALEHHRLTGSAAIAALAEAAQSLLLGAGRRRSAMHRDGATR